MYTNPKIQCCQYIMFFPNLNQRGVLQIAFTDSFLQLKTSLDPSHVFPEPEHRWELDLTVVGESLTL